MSTERKRGRPTKAPQTEGRVSLGLRVSAEIKRRLDAAAEVSGRSQSQEAEFRLERSFERQGLLREVLELAFGDFADALMDLQEHGTLRFLHSSDKEKIRAALKRFVDDAVGDSK